MAAAKTKKNIRLSTQGVLNLDDEEVLIEIEDFDEPVSFKELYKEFNGHTVNISIDTKIEYSQEG